MVVNNTFGKEMAVRKRIANIGVLEYYNKITAHSFNKREEDFPSLREYSDYLEKVEDMVFNLIEGIHVPDIEATIAHYQLENAEQIMISQARKAEEYAAAALAASKGHSTETENGTVIGPSSQAPGGYTVALGHYAPALPGGAIGQPCQPVPLCSDLDMSMYEYEDEEKMKLRVERAARAGGWSIVLSKKRALEEAFSNIWL